jgi:MFS superfamily sulfate permease-like transporter
VALGVANALAGVSSTFVVNGSPTKTAVVDAAGGRTQVSQLVTALVTLAVLLVATVVIEHLPNAALAALVFLIGARLIDVRALRQLWRLTRGAFVVAVATLLAVVFLGVEQGIFLAIGLSILDHLRREYHPKDVVLAQRDGRWKAQPATPGAHTAPGLIVYRFESDLFFGNADYFAARVQGVVSGAPHPVRWLVLDLVSLSDIDYTGGLLLESTVAQLQEAGVTVVFTEADAVRTALDQYGITQRVGAAHIFETLQEAVEAFSKHQLTATSAAPAAAG